MMNKITLLLTCAVCIISCNPGKKLNQAVAERNKQMMSNVKIQTPVARSTPDNINMVYDFEGLYTTAQNRKLDTLLRTFEKSNLIPIKLVTTGTQYLQGGTFEQALQQQAAEWEKVHGNSGRTMLVLISRQLQKADVAAGPFANKFISRAEIENILMASRTYFEQNDAYAGTWEGMNAIMNTIRKNLVYDPKPIAPKK